jgi:protein-histidine pros-kinase
LLMAAVALRRHREAMRNIARHRDQLEAETLARAAELNELYGHLQTVQEQERSRLARGLHDGLGGLLLAARMDVTWLQQHWRAAEAGTLERRLARVLEVLDAGIDLKRRVVEELRPTLLDNMGLIAAIRWQMDETCGRSGVRCHGDFPKSEPQLNARAAIALFRVAQEALLNVQKHAGAHEIRVRLELTPADVVLTVHDDGKGIADTDRRKTQAHGLAGMKHRVSALGGTLFVGLGADGGTEVRATLPRQQALYPAPAEPEVGATPLSRHARR